MTVQQPLTSEYFWKEVLIKYPNATKRFMEWVQEYKKAVNWDGLFGKHETRHYGRLVCSGIAPEFSQLPHAMQQGIWLEYLCQRGGCQFEIEDFFEYDLAKDICESFEHLLEDEAKHHYEP